MTAKERREMERLKAKNDILTKSLKYAHRASGDLIFENVGLKCALSAINELLQEAGEIMKSVEIEK
jgi:hypothetical protein